MYEVIRIVCGRISGDKGGPTRDDREGCDTEKQECRGRWRQAREEEEQNDSAARLRGR